MKKVILIILMSNSLFFCSDNNLNSNNVSYDLDSTIFMYGKINSDIFYGRDFRTNHLITDSMDHSTVFRAFFPIENIQIQLNRRMTLNNPRAMPTAYIKKDSTTYVLSLNEPFDLTFTTLKDSLISGTFYGKFVNARIAEDTISISDAYFRIFPKLENSFYLSLIMDDIWMSTSFGYEHMQRNELYVSATDTAYQDSLIATLSIKVMSFSNDFIGEHNFGFLDKYLKVILNLSSKNSDFHDFYIAYTGSVFINDTHYYEEDGVVFQKIAKTNFNFEAQNIDKEIIKINDGNFSISGF